MQRQKRSTCEPKKPEVQNCVKSNEQNVGFTDKLPRCDTGNVLSGQENTNQQHITSNVTYNVAEDKDKYIVNVYPVINIAGAIQSGHPIIANVNLNIEK